MSRSYCTYDEDWQRRKSVQFRSLFHDIPILSPVQEESNDSSNDVPTQEVFPSPPRPYSPLPPLIIEKIPITNKHDEPEEYYRKLHKKIKKIYEKLFLEKRNVSSVDFDSNYSNSSINNDSEHNTEGTIENLVRETENNSPEISNFESIIEDGEVRQSSASTNSNGYGADFESMDTAVIDVVNHTVSNEDVIMISEEEESEKENIEDDGIIYEDFGNCRSSENKQFSTERMDDRAFSEKEQSHHSKVHDQDTTETEESDETESEQNDETEGSDNEIKDDRNSNNQESKWEEFKRTGSGGRHELIASNDEPMEADVETSQSSEGPYYRQITTEAVIHFDGSQVPGERESIVYEDSVKSIILPTRYRRMLVSRNADVEDRIEVYTELEENADPKIASTFDFDDSETTEEDLEEMTTSNPETSLENDEKMSTRQLDAIEEVDEEMYAPSDRNFEEIGTPQPDAIEEDDEEIESLHSIELMRTPRLDLSHGTIPITQRSYSASSSEHTALPQELTALTSSIQDDADHNISELHISNDVNEILTSILNESQKKDGTPISGTKRKLVDKSVQAVETSRLTWEEMRANFFVGTPKIFRLCACTNHICS